MHKALNVLAAVSTIAGCGGVPTTQEQIDQGSQAAEQRLSAQELAALRCRQGTLRALMARETFVVMSHTSLSMAAAQGFLSADTNNCLATGELPSKPKTAQIPEDWLNPYYRFNY